MSRYFTLLFLGGIAIPFILKSQFVNAEDDILEGEEIEVIGITPTHGVGLPRELIPYSVQSATSTDLARTQSLDLADFFNRNLGSVHINEAQNNPLQPDVQFRGFTASPLLGLPQGLAIYQNGVRINEPFGDTMNWDLVPESSIASINLVGGANPIFGLNTLGGAISITTKNGFTHPGHYAEAYGGSFERIVGTIESGWNNGTWGYYFTGNYFDEEGWRDDSPSDALNLFGVLSYRDKDTTLDLNVNIADTDLIGNGASPVELLALDREAIFTSPDQTENELYFVNLQGSHWLTNSIQTSGNIFYRRIDTDTFNGDGTEFEDDGTGLLVDEDGELVEDQFGNNIASTNANGTERNAINNISTREQEGFGGTLQTTFLSDLFNHNNQLIVGASYQQGVIDFFQATEIATLVCEFTGGDCEIPSADRSTTGSGLFAVEEGTRVKAHNRNWSLYVTDTFNVTDRLAMTVSARYNNSHIVTGDRSSRSNLVDPDDPEDLNGEHDYDRINPAVGLTFQMNPQHSVYASYSESSRAPTPIELLCADPDAPCNLPNAFLADPPLEQVVTESFEGGFRGNFNNIAYHVGGFHATNKDDIIFTSTGGVSSNEGFFRNVGETRRVGGELNLVGAWNKLDWFLNYSFVDATFRSPFIAASANHPNAEDLNGDGEDAEIQVDNGDRIPGIPRHIFKLGGDYYFTPGFSIGGDLVYNSDQFLRGDEANLLDTVDGYAVVNVRGKYKINNSFTLFARINNLFNTDYETFGLLGEADEIFDEFEDPRFLGPGAPISGFIGVAFEF